MEKVTGAKSAGRVQSVALRLICERELAMSLSNLMSIGKLKAM